MIEPTHGDERVSGPGRPLMLGLVGTGALLLAFLAGFQLGHAGGRTVVITETAAAAASAAATAPASGISRIRAAGVDHELQQAYYNNLRPGAWVVCIDQPELACVPVSHVLLDGGSAFHPASEQWARVEPAEIPHGSRIYLVGDVPGRTWIADVAAPYAGSYRQLLGVTINGAVQYFDLGAPRPGRYVVISQSVSVFVSGPVTFAAGLIVR